MNTNCYQKVIYDFSAYHLCNVIQVYSFFSILLCICFQNSALNKIKTSPLLLFVFHECNQEARTKISHRQQAYLMRGLAPSPCLPPPQIFFLFQSDFFFFFFFFFILEIYYYFFFSDIGWI